MSLAPGEQLGPYRIVVVIAPRTRRALRSCGTTAGFVRGNTPGAFADASPDGKRFLMALPVALNNAQQQSTAVMNWTGILKK